MRISVTEAQDQLVELVRRAEAGDEVVLTQQQGRPDIRLVPEEPKSSRKGKLDRKGFQEFVAELQKSAAKKALPGPSAARSADFLYDDETGLPK